MVVSRHPSNRGFTLIEILVVIGIIGVIIAMLLPALTRSRQVANSVVCASNLRNIGMYLLAYSNDYQGMIYPVGDIDPTTGDWLTLGYGSVHVDGSPVTQDERWTAIVFGVWNPKIMVCPSDYEPVAEHSYLLNKHLETRPVQCVHAGVPEPWISDSDTVVMGEKITSVGDYYMEAPPRGGSDAARETEFDRTVETARHGIKIGSNYLYLDWHVAIIPPNKIMGTLDSWDIWAPPGQGFDGSNPTN